MNPQDLRKINVLRAHKDEALARLGAVLEQREFADSETIFAEASPGDGMHFILSGAVRIEKRAGAADGSKTLAVIEAGDYFGEMSLFDQKPRSASAVAAGHTQTLWLSKAAFDALPKEGSEAGMSLLFAMIGTSSDRIRRLNRQVIAYDEIGKAIGEAPGLDQLLDVVARELCHATTGDWGMVLLRAQFYEGIEIRGSANLQLNAEQREALARGGSFWMEILCDARERLVRSTADEDPFKSATRLDFESSSLLLMPIRTVSQLLGLIVLGAQRVGQFDVNDLNLARGVARQAAQAILNARHREEEQARARHGRQFVRF